MRRIIFKILFKLRVPYKWAGNFAMYFFRKEMEKVINKIDLDTKDIRITRDP